MSDISRIAPVPRKSDGRLDLESSEAQEILAAYKSHVRTRARANNTVTAYQSDWDHFVAWCTEVGVDSLPAHEFSVIAYLNFYGDHPEPSQRLKVSTLRRRLAGMKFYHAMNDAPFLDYRAADHDPIKDTLVALAREQSSVVRKAKPISQSLLIQMANSCLGDALGQRDRTLLLVGFLGALRRSELVGLDHEDIEIEDDGMVLNLYGTKTDQEGEGQRVYIPYTRHAETCAVRQYRAWRSLTERDSGPVFTNVTRYGDPGPNRLDPEMVSKIVKRLVKEVGESPEGYSAHSLRHGLATASARSGAGIRTLMKQTRHTRMETLEGYIQDGQGYSDNVVNVLGEL